MNLSLNLTKIDKKNDSRENLIAIRVQTLIDDKYFINDFVEKQSYVSDDHSNSRTHIGSYYFDKEEGIYGGGIDVYLLYTKEQGPLIVGVLSKAMSIAGDNKAVLFELPVALTEDSLARSSELGFDISLPDDETQWIDSDFISETYFGGSTVITTTTQTTFQKTVAEKYHLYITVE
ncbi:hypothetical protein RAAC3_TM7C00001G0440 [Candidatus Saccharibacteria bacterium RAAC3_TM7_1]|nr:hypothetical protein RAAC3_TM7C00001G0440 [Candidatus Saccharibacteria bacterium RAAC3_TM7_1]